MQIAELCKLYAKQPQVAALAKALGKTTGSKALSDNDVRAKDIVLGGLSGSAAPMVFAALANLPQPPRQTRSNTFLFVLNDVEEAGYFYHDLMQMMGEGSGTGTSDGGRVLFFPSSYRRAVKYAQRDAANEILRTETLARLKMIDDRYDYKKNAETLTAQANHISHLSSFIYQF